MNIDHELQSETPELHAPVPTILYMMNPDCWRAVLDYLDIDDVVRLERVCRGLQEVVLEYLPSVKSYYYTRDESNQPRDRFYRRIKCKRMENDLPKKMKEKRYELFIIFKKMLKKLSPYAVHLYLSLGPRRIINEEIVFEMDKLEDITLYEVPPQFIDNVVFVNCKRLERMTVKCFQLRDNHLDRIVNSSPIKELSISFSDNITGEFLINLKANITHLSLNWCPRLQIENLLASNVLHELIKLELNYNSTIDMDSVLELVAKMPKLEFLSLNNFKHMRNCDVRSELVEAIGQLSELKQFSMCSFTTDDLLATLAKCCKKLQILHIEGSEAVSGAALISLCRELPALTELHVAGCDRLADEHLAACLESPNLTVLDASRCYSVSRELARAAARSVRRRPRALRLLVDKPLRKYHLCPELKEEKRMGLTVLWVPRNS